MAYVEVDGVKWVSRSFLKDRESGSADGGPRKKLAARRARVCSAALAMGRSSQRPALFLPHTLVLA